MKAIPVLPMILLTLVFSQEMQGPGRTDRITTPKEQIQGSQERDQERAIKAAEDRMQADPYSAEAHLNLAEIYLHYFGRARLHNEKILAEYHQAIQLNPRYAEAYCGMASYFALKADHKCQVKALNKAVALKPDYAEAYCKLGYAYLDEESRDGVRIGITDTDLKLAVDAFNTAIQIKPNLTAAYNGLGSATYRLGLYKDSVSAFGHALVLAPDDIMAHTGIGIVYIQIGQKEAAIQEYEALIRLGSALAASRPEVMKGNSLNPANDWAAYLLRRIQERYGN